MKLTLSTNNNLPTDEEKQMFNSVIDGHLIAKKRAIPRELTWKEIKQKYAHVIQRSKVVNGSVEFN